jgi:hypothetical protein
MIINVGERSNEESKDDHERWLSEVIKRARMERKKGTKEESKAANLSGVALTLFYCRK